MSVLLLGPRRRGPDRFRGRGAIGAFTTALTVASLTPNAARLAGGTAITITGTGFTPGSVATVLIGGVAATSVVVVNSTTITAVVPASTVTGAVSVVVTIGSQTVTLERGFIYYAGTLASLSPSYGGVGGGTAVLIAGYNFVAGSTVTFGGVAATDVTLIDDQHLSVTTPAHAVGYVDVVITEPLGPTVRLTSGFHYTVKTRANDIRWTPGIKIEDTLGQANVCTYVIDGQSHKPEPGETISVIDSLDGNRLLFAGNVQSVDQVFEGKPTNLAWSTKAVDFTALLNRLRPFGVYVDMSVSDIVADLVATYAPGFTATHVQTNLATISISFDGSDDFVTCLNNLGAAIGGGHWYVDYNRDVHFFHVLPPLIVPGDLPQTILRLGPGTAMTVTEGAAPPTVSSITPTGFYIFRSTFVYDNGIESAMGPLSNPVPIEGNKLFAFAGVPIGPAAGSLTCVARRIYYEYFANPNAGGPQDGRALGQWAKFCQVNDNVTTDFETVFKAIGASVPAVIAIPASTVMPLLATVVSPPASETIPTVIVPDDLFQDTMFTPQAPLIGSHAPIAISMGSYQFLVTCLYRDGTQSLPVLSETVTIFDEDGAFGHSPTGAVIVRQITSNLGLANLPIGPSVNGVDCIARIVYGHFMGRGATDAQWTIPAMLTMWYLVPDNTTTAISDLANSTWGAQLPAGSSPNDHTLPVWPNPDGPSLEDTDPPDGITGANPLLLDPPFRMSVDTSQLRNQIIVKGPATTTIGVANPGDTTLGIADTSIFAGNGGQVLGASRVLGYFGMSTGTTENPNGRLYLTAPLTVSVPEGSLVQSYLQLDDIESQKTQGAAERDAAGNPTDGIHQFVIDDASLVTPFDRQVRAAAELELYSRPIVTIGYATRDPKTKAGQTVHVDLATPPCVGDFLIQHVTIDQIWMNGIATPRYTVSASSVRFDLSDFLLKLMVPERPEVRTAGIIPAATHIARGQGTWDLVIVKQEHQDTEQEVLDVVDDQELQFEVRDQSTWWIELLIRYAAGTPGRDLHWDVAISNGTMAGAVHFFGLTVGNLAQDVTLAMADVVKTPDATAMGTGEAYETRPFRAVVFATFTTEIPGSTAQFKFRWCGNSASGTVITRVCAGSILRAQQIGRGR